MFEGVKFSTFKHKESTCYIALKEQSTFDDSGNEINNYGKPEKFKFNIQPVSTANTSDIQEFGENIGKMKVAIILNRDKYEGKFKEFDLAYLDGITPEGESKNGENANYRVYSVRNQNVAISVFFIKLVK